MALQPSGPASLTPVIRAPAKAVAAALAPTTTPAAPWRSEKLDSAAAAKFGECQFDSSDEAELEARNEVDWPLFTMEVVVLVMALLSLLLVISGLGFFTVHPPGEEDLCTVETLGLANETQSEQREYLHVCHGLYLGVFDVLGFIGAVHIFCGVVSSVSVVVLALGMRRTYAGEALSSSRCFCCGVAADIFGALVVWLPSWLFPGLAAIVSAGLAPIHAYFLAIMVGHYGMKAANATEGEGHQGVSAAAHVEDTVYKGYAAASRVELCLGTGSFCLLVLFWILVADVGRHVVSMTCWRPQYQKITGLQFPLAFAKARNRWRGTPAAAEDSNSE